MPHLPISPPEAASELLRRRTARRTLIAFTEYTNPAYRAADHHRMVAAALEDIAAGTCGRLMVFMPPRHGKSELASRRFPAWYLGKRPDRQIIAASYNGDLAADFGREVRNIVASQAYGALFETRLAADSQAANRWHTDAGGMYAAAGVGTAITGRGAHVFLIDDPIKDREEADSEIVRRKVWDWYRSVAYTRLMPGGAVVLIQTRWHEDDLAGRLLAGMDDSSGDTWRVVSLPALDEAGEALWPAWYAADDLARIRQVIGEREWSALYQQRPTPEEGDYFRREWLRWYDTPPKPETLRVYGASDYAVTADGGDFTVHGVAGLDPDDNLYLLDWWRARTDSAAWVDAWVALVTRWRPVEWGEEAGQISKSLGPFLDKRQREARAYCLRKQFPSVADKPTRAQAIRGRFAQGKVYLPKAAPWAADLVGEMMAFPAGKYDDQVDVLGLFGRMLTDMRPARPGPRPAVADGTDYDPFAYFGGRM